MAIAHRYDAKVGVGLQAVRAFVAVAATGSFRAAAKLLNVSQPTVSAAVARLEAQAGAPLLRREHSGVSLTDHGQRTLAAASRLVAAADELDAMLTGGSPRELTLGFMGEAAASVTGKIIAVVQKWSPARVNLRRFDFDDPTCGLTSGKSDLAIIWPPVSTDAIDQMVIATDRRAIAFSVSDPLAGRDTVSPEELGRRNWVVPCSPDPMWTGFRHPTEIGVVTTRGIVGSNSVEETLELVASGAGNAILSESTDQHYVRTGVVLVPIAGDVRCTTALAWQRDAGHPAIADILDDVHSLGLPLR